MDVFGRWFGRWFCFHVIFEVDQDRSGGAVAVKVEKQHQEVKSSKRPRDGTEESRKRPRADPEGQLSRETGQVSFHF